MTRSKTEITTGYQHGIPHQIAGLNNLGKPFVLKIAEIACVTPTKDGMSITMNPSGSYVIVEEEAGKQVMAIMEERLTAIEQKHTGGTQE